VQRPAPSAELWVSRRLEQRVESLAETSERLRRELAERDLSLDAMELRLEDMERYAAFARLSLRLSSTFRPASCAASEPDSIRRRAAPTFTS